MATLLALLVVAASAFVAIAIVLMAERGAGMVIGALKDRGQYHSED